MISVGLRPLSRGMIVIKAKLLSQQPRVWSSKNLINVLVTENSFLWIRRVSSFSFTDDLVATTFIGKVSSSHFCHQ